MAIAKFDEFICQCPGCLTIETVWVRHRTMAPTKRFHQDGNREIYHDCGCQLPLGCFPFLKNPLPQIPGLSSAYKDLNIVSPFLSETTS